MKILYFELFNHITSVSNYKVRYVSRFFHVGPLGWSRTIPRAPKKHL